MTAEYSLVFRGQEWIWCNGSGVTRTCGLSRPLQLQVNSLCEFYAEFTREARTPSDEEKLIFRRIYDQVVSILINELSRTGKVSSPQFPDMFESA